MTIRGHAAQADQNDAVARSVRAAILFQVALGAYLQIVEWIPLGRWNNVANGNGQGQLDVIIAICQIVILIFFWRHWRWLMAVGVAVNVWWAWMEIQFWWIPYFFGGSAQWMEVYNHWFKNTWKFLPAIDGHPIPDAEHTVLMALIFCVIVSGVGATLACFRSKQKSKASPV